jgi:hypothetical protein
MTVSSYTGVKDVESFTTGGAITSDKQGLFLVASGTGTVAVNTTAKGYCVGVFAPQNDVASGGQCAVIVGGRVDVQAGGTIVKGGLVASNNAGKAVAFADGYALGRALSAGTSGGIVTVQLLTAYVPAS